MDPVQTQVSQVDAKETRRRVVTIGYAAMAAEFDRRVVQASPDLVADIATIAQLVLHDRLKAATAPVGSQVAVRRLATATIATMALAQVAARVRQTAVQAATEVAAEIKVAAMELHAAAVQAVQVALAAEVVVHQLVGDLVPTHEVGVGANTRRRGLKRRLSAALLK